MSARRQDRGELTRKASWQGGVIPSSSVTRALRGLALGSALAFCLAALGTPSPALAQDIDGFSTWAPGDKGRPRIDGGPSRGTRSGRRRKKLANHASTIADQSIRRERKGIYRTIRKAIDHTAPGGTVIIRPGFYNESLTLTWPVQLRGDVRVGHNELEESKGKDWKLEINQRAVDKVVLRPPAGSSCLRIKVKRDEVVDIRDMWLHQTAGGSLKACVDHGSGDLVITDSVVESHAKAPAIVLTGHRATIDSNTIRGALVGVYVAPSQGFSDSQRSYALQYNRIYANEVGVSVDSFGALTHLRENRITRNKNAGILMSKGGVHARHNKIRDNQTDGVVILYTEFAEMIGNDVLGNGRYGVYMPLSAPVKLEDNLIVCNGVAGVAPGKDDYHAKSIFPNNVIEHNPPEKRKRVFRRLRSKHPCKDYYKRAQAGNKSRYTN